MQTPWEYRYAHRMQKMGSSVIRELLKGSANQAVPRLFPADTILRAAYLLPDGTVLVAGIGAALAHRRHRVHSLRWRACAPATSPPIKPPLNAHGTSASITNRAGGRPSSFHARKGHSCAWVRVLDLIWSSALGG